VDLLDMLRADSPRNRGLVVIDIARERLYCRADGCETLIWPGNDIAIRMTDSNISGAGPVRHLGCTAPKDEDGVRVVSRRG
jgi:RNase P subunit RPR2